MLRPIPLTVKFRKSNSEVLEFLAITSTDRTNWVKTLLEHGGERDNTFVQASKEISDIESVEDLKSNSVWYPVKDHENTVLNTQSESFAPKKRTKKVLRKGAKRVKPKQMIGSSKATKTIDARTGRKRVPVKVDESQVVAHRACGKMRVVSVHDEDDSLACKGSPRTATRESRTRIAKSRSTSKVSKDAGKGSTRLTKAMEALQLELVEERAKHAKEIKVLHGNYTKIQKLLVKESKRCEVLQGELCELSEKRFQDRVEIARLNNKQGSVV